MQLPSVASAVAMPTAKTDFDVRKTRPVVIDVVAVRRKHSTPDQGINPLDLNVSSGKELHVWKAFCR